EVEERYAGASQGDSEAGFGLAGRQIEADPGSRERTGEAAWPQAVEHRDGRHVERILQRFGGADLALEAAVEIARRIVAELTRPVVEHGLRVDQQPVERHRVDKRL